MLVGPQSPCFAIIDDAHHQKWARLKDSSKLTAIKLGRKSHSHMTQLVLTAKWRAVDLKVLNSAQKSTGLMSEFHEHYRANNLHLYVLPVCRFRPKVKVDDQYIQGSTAVRQSSPCW